MFCNNKGKCRAIGAGISCAIVLIVLLFLSAAEGRIRHQRKYSWRSILNIHQNPSEILLVDDKKYPNVMGCPPFYLEISPIKSILFVTLGPDSSETMHVYSLERKLDTTIPLGYITFGGHVGSANPDFAKRISNITDDGFDITSKIMKNETYYHVDLRRHAIQTRLQ